MKITETKQGPNLQDFSRGQETLYLVKRYHVVEGANHVVVIANLYGGGKQAFVQAYTLDSWVIAGCYKLDVLEKQQLKKLFELSPRYEATEEWWDFLVDKAQTGKLESPLQKNGLGVRE